MKDELSDLLPVFLAEASGRLERLNQLLSQIQSDPQIRREAQRELHTLKGSGRMLKLTDFAQLCHQLEEIVQQESEACGPALQKGLDELSSMLARLAEKNTAPTGGGAPLVTSAVDHMRLDSKQIDLFTDRATRMRIYARSAAIFHERLLELVRLAEQGVFDPNPSQVLAVLSTSLRSLALVQEAGQKRAQRLADSILEHALSLQLQPLGPLLQTLARHARELGHELGKDLQVTIKGEDVKLDRRIAREIEEALIHLVRNAVDHGLEDPGQRQKLGKSIIGSITLEAKVEVARVYLSVADDGQGIDSVKVLEKAVAQGLVSVSEASQLSREQILRLLFLPGFSTQDKATQVSGRGVGLDAVAAACSRVGGDVALSSHPGKGTIITLSLPAARRGEEVLIIKVGSTNLLYPKAAVRYYRPLSAENVVERGERLYFSDGKKLIPFFSLARLVGEEETLKGILLSGEAGGGEVSVAVDAVLGEEEVVIRGVASPTMLPAYFAGAAVLASGKALPLLAPTALTHVQRAKAAVLKSAKAGTEKLQILLVDDSLVTREMERRLFADAGFSVLVAADAEEALVTLGEKPVDCLVTDIEMPGMSGLELTQRLRALPQFAHLPIIVVSTKDRPEDRLAGLAAGADAYLVKQGLDASELVSLVRRLGGRG